MIVRHSIMGLVLVFGIPFGVSSPGHAVFWILLGALVAVLLPYLAVLTSPAIPLLERLEDRPILSQGCVVCSLHRRLKELTMAVFMGAFPVLPGKEDEPRKFAEETLGRREELEASQQRFGVTKEEWSLQQTPMGWITIVRFETPDVASAFEDLAQSEEPFDIWFRQRVLEISGVDLGAPMEGPPPEIIFDWSS